MTLKSWSRPILVSLFLLTLASLSMAQVSVNISVGAAPPELPVYDQPPIPGDGYVWTPGYWAWSDDIQDFYWVPGTWILAPQPGYLWTPGYWGASGAAFFWHPGYWGPQVGFYGGVNYGYGYGGEGYQGGYWQGGHMYYNRSVNNFGSTHITNVYNRTVVNNVTVNRVSYNGGRGGTRARPSAADEAAAHERHIAATSMQREHVQAAQKNPALRASENKRRPPIAATARPGAFKGPGVVATRGGSTGGTMSVTHAKPPPRSEPETRTAAPRQESSEVERRPESPEHNPAPRPAPAERRAPAERPAPAQRPAPAPRPAPAERPAPGQRPAPAEHPRPRAEPHPPEHAPEHSAEHAPER